MTDENRNNDVLTAQQEEYLKDIFEKLEESEEAAVLKWMRILI